MLTTVQCRLLKLQFYTFLLVIHRQRLENSFIYRVTIGRLRIEGIHTQSKIGDHDRVRST